MNRDDEHTSIKKALFIYLLKPWKNPGRIIKVNDDMGSDFLDRVRIVLANGD
jgi:hypothetical protein